MISFATLFSSSKGNSVFVATDNTKILVDAGMPLYKMEEAITEVGSSLQDIDGILITHEHIDHTKSAGSISRKYHIPVYATKKVWEQCSACFGNMPPGLQRTYDYDLTIGDFSFTFFKTFHDAVQPIGMVITNGSTRLGICTDTGMVSPKMIQILHDVNGIVFEANHDPDLLRNSRYPYSLQDRIAGNCGHLSNEDSATALNKIIGDNTKEIILAHLSEESNRPELAYEVISNSIARLPDNLRPNVRVACPCRVSELITLY